MSDILKTEFAGAIFKNPVVLASGTCGFGAEFNESFDISLLGGICAKGLTLLPREGNRGIRAWETASGLLNSVGLENPGVEAFVRNELAWLRTVDVNVIVNLGGHSVDDYVRGAEALNSADFDLLELNISCPNVKEGGMNFGVKTEVARKVVREVRSVCRHPMVVKLSPNAEDVVSVAVACEDEGADGVSLVNTFLGMAIDIDARKPVFNNVYAGLSGPAIKPVALRMVHQAAKALSIPVMGIGGITTWKDALEFIMAGASVIQVGTANFIRPSIALDIIKGMETWLGNNGVRRVADIRGIV
ncbi:MAG: dihydroorotate dehydrogenase [Clostridiales Family XIII bacterium]|jgi:dihydroorotate dehydrogenase (NAD+) catalytic subunit|nr:dihydroorotate dehydrogenase [Clostridiales Family XIII bacterium]